MRSPRKAFASALAASLVLAAAMSVTPVRAGGIGTTITQHDVKNLTTEGDVRLHIIRGNTVDGPIRAWLVEIDPGPATFDVATPNNQLPGRTKVSDMGIAHRAAAAINGDFGFDRPLHAFAQDGNLWQSGLQTHGNVAVAKDETHAWIGRPRTAVDVLNGSATNVRFGVDRWNSGAPKTGEIAGYSPQGGSVANPPSGACSARLTSPGALTWAPGRNGLQRTYRVDAERCDTSAMAENGGVVVSTKNSAGPDKQAITDLAPGNTVTVRWKLAWPGVMDSVGGRPMLVENGANVAPTTCRICGRNPRSAVAINQACENGGAACRVYLVIVDGRQGGWSVGMTLRQLAAFLAMPSVADAHAAVNMDGGGSAVMWVRKQGNHCWKNVSTGCVVNRPTTNGTTLGERTAETALLALGGSDTDPSTEPNPAGP